MRFHKLTWTAMHDHMVRFSHYKYERKKFARSGVSAGFGFGTFSKGFAGSQGNHL